MDDMDLDKIDLDSFNSDETDSKRQQTSAGSDNNSNRPRLRKIKRPKQHNGPINATPQSSSGANYPSNTGRPSVSNTAGSSSEDSKIQGGLIRASDRSNYAADYNNYPSPGYVENYNEPKNDEDEFVYQGTDNSLLARLDNKKLVMIFVGCFLLGLLFGKFMFSTEQVVRNGLQGVVVNPEVPKGRSRCGVAEKTQGCVLYVMNPQRQELNGRDFYDLAAQLTGRQRFVIETGNMRYSSVKIKPGSIAQLNIPPLQ